MNAIATRGLTKVFGAQRAVDRLDLEVPTGSVFGFLGPNGAGKTTTLRMLVGLSRPTSGTAEVLGVPIGAPGKAYRQKIGYLPDVPGFYDWMTPAGFLSLVGSVFGLSSRDSERRAAEVLELAGLGGVKKRIGGFSRGMKQRLGLAQAMMNDPELLFLDEPTSALDPIGRREVLEAVSRLRGRTTVFFSTHILNDVERVCDMVAILNGGRLVTQQRIDDLRESYASHFIYLELEDKADFTALAADRPWLGRVEPFREGWRLMPPRLREAQKGLPELLSANGMIIRRFELLEPSLEDIFVGLVNGK
ncbi:MAG: ATP-binding cassette domain-containing protein [Patescibacteria group bacterium]